MKGDKQKIIDKNTIISLLYPLFALALIVILWAVTAKAVGSDLIVPSIGSTFEGLGQLLGEKSTYVDIAATLLRAMRGFVLSFAIALLLALAATFFRPFAKTFAPIVAVMRSTPTMSVILLCLLWTNTQIAPVFVTVLIIFPLLYTAFYGEFTGVDSKLVEMAKVYKVPYFTRLTKMYIPIVLPGLFNAVRSTLSLTIKLTIAAEVLAQTKNSIGVDMQLANLYLDTPLLIAWTLIAIGLGAVAELIVIALSRLCTRWKNA